MLVGNKSNNDIIIIVDIEIDKKSTIYSPILFTFIYINMHPSKVDNPDNNDNIKGPIISIFILKLYTLYLVKIP